MPKFQVKVRKLIMMGVLEETHNVEADVEETALNIVENDSTTYCVDIDYNIKETEIESVIIIKN